MKKIGCILILLLIVFIFSACEKIIDGGEIDWFFTAKDYLEELGSKIKFKLPPNKDGFSGAVWGTDVYSYDSAIGAAAVHAGVITLEAGGEVTIEILEGASSYKGTTDNGITTSDWGPYDYSYKFIK